jgi:hypothetical protein
MENQQKQDAAPTKEQMLTWMQEQIEFKKVQAELQELDTRIAVARAEYVKAMYTIAQISTPHEGSNAVAEHTLTEEDLEANPELKEQGLKVGDVIGIPTEIADKEEKKAPISNRALKK